MISLALTKSWEVRKAGDQSIFFFKKLYHLAGFENWKYFPVYLLYILAWCQHQSRWKYQRFNWILTIIQCPRRMHQLGRFKKHKKHCRKITIWSQNGRNWNGRVVKTQDTYNLDHKKLTGKFFKVSSQQ